MILKDKLKEYQEWLYATQYSNFMKSFLEKKLGGVIATLGLLFFLALTIIIFYLAWLFVILPIWNWGGQVWYQLIIAILADGIILIFFFSFLISIISRLWKILRFYVEIPSYIRSPEEELIDRWEKLTFNRLEQIEKKLFQVIKYRRESLNYYYNTNFNQTKKSYRYSIIAMFIGFIIIIIGIISAFGFFDIVSTDIKETEINNVVIAGGVIAEMISALFLWIYNASSKQLMYFYSQQIQAHNALISFIISGTMKKETEEDKAKEKIIECILKPSKFEQLELPSGKGFKKLLKEES